MARLAIARAFLTEYAKLDTKVHSAVDAAVTRLAKHAHPGQQLEKPKHTRDDRIRLMRVDTRWRGIVLTPAVGLPRRWPPAVGLPAVGHRSAAGSQPVIR